MECMKGELFKGAFAEFRFEDGKVARDYKLVNDLHVILAVAFSSGKVPDVWCAAFLSAVFQKGDAALTDNYRGIAVGAVMGKLYSIVLDARLSSFREEHGFRAKGQAGFRREKRTSDHVRRMDPEERKVMYDADAENFQHETSNGRACMNIKITVQKQ